VPVVRIQNGEVGERRCAPGITVAIPPIPGGNPTGTVFNGTSDFHGDAFLFVMRTAPLPGGAARWEQTAEVVVPSSSANVYKGLASGVANGNNFLYAANFKTVR